MLTGAKFPNSMLKSVSHLNISISIKIHIALMVVSNPREKSWKVSLSGSLRRGFSY